MSASSASLLVNATLDDFASAFSYSSAWTAPDTSARGYPNGDTFLSTLVDGTYHAASSPNQTTALSFSGKLSCAIDRGHRAHSCLLGSAVYLYGVAGPSQGFYSLTLDGRSTSAPLSAFASSNISNTLLWSASDLSSDPHTLEITNLGQNGNSSVGNALLIDYALVTAVISAEK